MKAGKGNFGDTDFDSITIERERGATYSTKTFAVYGHGEWPASSVNAGRAMRSYIKGGYATPEAALADFPMATIAGGSSYVQDNFADLPGDDDSDPLGDNRAIAREMALDY